jgi:hypothetical protein
LDHLSFSDQLKKASKKVLHSFTVATSSILSAQENIALVHFIETENLKLARKKNFDGVMATNMVKNF